MAGRFFSWKRRLSPDEQKAFAQLWADVAALLKKAGGI
jgi:hypothetical protein